MMHNRFRTLIASALFCGLALSARAESPVISDPFMTPTQAEPGKAFFVTVSGTSNLCAPLFSEHKVVVSQNGRIDLTVKAVSNPAALCVAGATEYSTEFRIPALQAGEYQAYITFLPACMYEAMPCMPAPESKFAGYLTVGTKVAVAYTLNPTRAAADAEFTLKLLSYQFNCGTSYDNLATALSDSTLTLTYLDHENPNVACPAIYQPYGPSFKVPALKAGVYTVKAYRLPACHPCKMMGETADVGTLTIGDGGPRKGWYLKDPEVLANKTFSLQLLNENHGNCQTSYSHQSLVVESGAIHASFLVRNDTGIVCITDIRPHGPVFGMDGLKTGAYPVYVTELLQCEVTEPYCAVDRIAPMPSDTLIVMQTLSVLLSDLRARAPKADMRGSRAALILPEGKAGTWKADLLTPAGRRLASGSVTASGGGRAEIELGVKPDRGVYLLRLSAPEGKAYLIPLVRRD